MELNEEFVPNEETEKAIKEALEHSKSLEVYTSLEELYEAIGINKEED